MLNFVCDFSICVDEVGEKMVLCNLVAKPTIIEKIIESQLKDVELVAIMRKLSNGDLMEGWHMDEKEGLWFMGRLCVLGDP